MTGSPVRVEGLDELLRDLRDMDMAIDRAVARELAEGVERWKEDIRGDGRPPGEDDRWPIGTTRRSARTGRKYYTHAGDPKGEPSGRSLASWEVKQGRGRMIATNRARDPNTGREYAQWIHLAGDSKGQAVRDAWAHWEREFEQAADEIEQIIARELEG